MTRVFGKYNVLTTFQGGMGKVHIVFDADWQRLLALKTFASPHHAESLVREARAILELAPHINIVPVHFCDLWRDVPYLGMDCIVGPHSIGEGLHHLLRLRSLSIEQILALAVQICEGMIHLHGHGSLLHLDLKPSNILIDATLIVKLSDFGISQGFDPESPRSRGRHGTPGYMAPEQMSSGEVSPATDVFAFGVVLRQMLAEAKPPRRDTPYQAAHLAQLGRIVQKCTQPAPRDRYHDFRELKREILALYKEIRFFGGICG